MDGEDVRPWPHVHNQAAISFCMMALHQNYFWVSENTCAMSHAKKMIFKFNDIKPRYDKTKTQSSQ